MESELKKIICDTIDKKSTDLNDVSLSLWNNPELGLKEYHAHELLTSLLEKEGFKVERKTPLETAFIAKFGDPSGLKIGVCCEYDALPGIGHACGHNLIAEAGIGAALGIKEVLKLHPELSAQVIVYGTPAEEVMGGKVLMIEKGSFDEVDICMMSHPSPNETPSPTVLAISILTITFHGKASHAAAAPWEGINALDAAVACYNAISMLRQQIKPTCRVHCIFTDGGQKPNIIPERAELNIYMRGLTDEDTQNLINRVKNCANGAAISAGCTVEMNRDECDYSTLKTNKTMIDLYVSNAKSLGVEFSDTMQVGFGSTDMGNVSKIKPSIHPVYKIKTDGVNHTREFTNATGHDDSQPPTLNSAKSMAMTAIDVICNPNLMVDILNDFNSA